MTFNPYDPTAKNEKQSSREEDLIKAVFSTPQGRELVQIWKDKLVYAPVWGAAQPEPIARQIAGRHSVYRDIIVIAERKANGRRTESGQPSESGTAGG